MLWKKLACEYIPDPKWSGKGSCSCLGLAPPAPPESLPLSFDWIVKVDLLCLVSKAMEHESTSKLLWVMRFKQKFMQISL